MRYRESLEYAVELPFLTLFGQERYPGNFLKAAVIMERIIRGHPFTDGNKRTGYLAGITMLELLVGLTVETEEGEAVEVCLAVEDERMGAEELASWMFDHSDPIVNAFGDYDEGDTTLGLYKRRQS